MTAIPYGRVRPRWVCFHEAGHAFVRWYFGSGPDRAVVLTRDQVAAGEGATDGGSRIAGHLRGVVEGCNLVPSGLKRASLKDCSAEEIRSIMRMAEISLMINCAGILAAARYRKCSLLVSMLAGGGSDLRSMKATADEWFADQPDIRNFTARRTSALVRSTMGWTAITNVADELERVGEVDGSVISDICKDACGGRKPAPGAWFDHWPPTLDQLRASFVPERRRDRRSPV